MKKINLVINIFFLFLINTIQAQIEEVNSGTFLNDTLSSQILNEERLLSIYLPKNYNTSNNHYPVLYLLDGKEHIFHTAGIVEYLVSVGRMPKIIIIGINSTDRFRDYTPDKIEHHAGTGEAAKFTKFLTDELFTFIRNQYRVQDFRMIFGHSYAGSFVLNILFTQPELFGGYITASPNLFILKNLERKVEHIFKNSSINNRLMYITAGEQEKDFIKRLSEFTTILKDSHLDLLEWHFEILENENHSSTPHKTIYTALELFFRQFWQFNDDTDKIELKQQFKILSNRLGYDLKIPLSVLINLGNNALGNEKLNQAQSIFELLVELYPKSEWGYVNLGSVFYSKKDNLEAKQYFQKALELNPTNPYTQDMLREINN